VHDIEPFFNWRHLYTSEEDENSPFFGREYSEFEFSHTIYNYYIHPQWDHFGSHTLYLKLLFVDYDLNFAIIEMIGEWNDAVESDIIALKRDVLDLLIEKGIYHFIFITENVLNFHNGDEDYYDELYENIGEHHGWMVLLNTPIPTLHDFHESRIKSYFHFMEMPDWRTFQPVDIFQFISNKILKIENQDG